MTPKPILLCCTEPMTAGKLAPLSPRFYTFSAVEFWQNGAPCWRVRARIVSQLGWKFSLFSLGPLRDANVVDCKLVVFTSQTSGSGRVRNEPANGSVQNGRLAHSLHYEKPLQKTLSFNLLRLF